MSGSVLITGASTVIGLATALECRRLGYQILGTIRTGSVADRLVASGCQPIVADVTDDGVVDQVRETARRTQNPTDRLHALVNNADVPAADPSEYQSMDEITRAIAVTSRGSSG